MATELLLLCDVADLGKAGDIVKVADGYARNYLLPKDIAAPVTEGAKRRLEKLRKERNELAKIQLGEAKDKAAKIGKLKITIAAKTVDGERLYGSIALGDVLAAIEKDGKVSLDKSQLQMEDHLKEIGEFNIPVKLHAEVTTSVKIIIVEE
ncbi:MAG: 50S ribosomal protein L9 [Kiritimatiellae bacterium]|jgi:large subunit ribosomal protein L9|nr:50S ribosomal protein L9 [Kiritimatiellia bacterium]